MKTGDIVSTLAHPFISHERPIPPGNFIHMVPPCMVISEIKKSEDFNTETGEKEDSFKCLYYSNEKGQFVEHWFKGHELKLLVSDGGKDEGEDSYSLANLRAEFIGKTAILKTVDLELMKLKLSSDHPGEIGKRRENRITHFLPPLGTVISIRRSEEKPHYSRKTGEIIHEKPEWLFKIRFYNNAASKFSEDELPMNVLIYPKVELADYIEGKYYRLQLKQELKFEDNANVSIKYVPIQFVSAIWNHYYYKYRFRNVFTGEIIDWLDGNLGSCQEFEEWHKNETLRQYGFKDIPDPDTAQWLEIQYLDKLYRNTTRIVYIKTVDKDLLSTNCMLRNAAIRHFRKDGIQLYRCIDSGLMNVFFYD